ncbi:MAG: hypothetical protein EBV16_09055, partial [Betaproteobacteria bacterium]|nr:hypothetical protein [Betaproteobacteria bacterium]
PATFNPLNQFIRCIPALLLSACFMQSAWAQFNVSGPGFLPDENGTNPDALNLNKPTQEAPFVDEELSVFTWPAVGRILTGFDESQNRKGIDIGGESGATIFAASDGKVVYAGEGLRGYGKLIIIKHNNTFLTAYAHNQTILVREEQSVKAGQKIAEMGNSDADRVIPPRACRSISG